MNWYKLEIVRATLSADYGCAHAPTVVGSAANIEVWSRRLGSTTYIAQLHHERGELLVPELQLQQAAAALRIAWPELRSRLAERGGLWLGPG